MERSKTYRRRNIKRVHESHVINTYVLSCRPRSCWGSDCNHYCIFRSLFLTSTQADVTSAQRWLANYDYCQWCNAPNSFYREWLEINNFCILFESRKHCVLGRRRVVTNEDSKWRTAKMKTHLATVMLTLIIIWMLTALVQAQVDQNEILHTNYCYCLLYTSPSPRD